MGKGNIKATFVLHKPKNEHEFRLHLEKNPIDGNIDLYVQNYADSTQVVVDFANGAGRCLCCRTPLKHLKTDRWGRLKIKKEKNSG